MPYIYSVYSRDQRTWKKTQLRTILADSEYEGRESADQWQETYQEQMPEEDIYVESRTYAGSVPSQTIWVEGELVGIPLNKNSWGKKKWYASVKRIRTEPDRETRMGICTIKGKTVDVEFQGNDADIQWIATELSSYQYRPRDKQKQRVYDAESRALNRIKGTFSLKDKVEGWGLQMTLEGCQAFIDEAMKSEAWENLADKSRPARVHVEFIKGQISWARGERIQMAQAHRNKLILLHELAHVGTTSKHGSHGEEYCWFYLELVKEILGEHIYNILKEEFEKGDRLGRKINFKPEKRS